MKCLSVFVLINLLNISALSADDHNLRKFVANLNLFDCVVLVESEKIQFLRKKTVPSIIRLKDTHDFGYLYLFHRDTKGNSIYFELKTTEEFIYLSKDEESGFAYFFRIGDVKDFVFKKQKGLAYYKIQRHERIGKTLNEIALAVKARENDGIIHPTDTIEEALRNIKF